MSAAAVTPAGVRDGDPAALAALCSVRGPSVLAYCRHVAGDDQAVGAAEDAFAGFRMAVVSTPDTSNLNPEALLINATRAAAAARAGTGAQGVCAEVPALLAARAGRSISDADRERLDRHLESCWTCRAPVARFKAAERAYRDPPDPTLDPAVAERIVAALATAVPDADPKPEPAPLGSPAANGAGHGPTSATVDQPTREFGVADVFRAGLAPRVPLPLPSEQPHVEQPSPPAVDERPDWAQAHPLPSEQPYSPSSTAPDPPPPAQPQPAWDPRPPAPPAAETPRRDRDRDLRASAGGFMASVLESLGLRGDSPGQADRDPPRRRSETRGSRRRDSTTAAGSARSERSARSRGNRRDTSRRPKLPLPVLLPIVVVVVAVLLALFVAGVFGGSDPASSPSVSAPADAPRDPKPADVVVVPGSVDAGGRAVELAKARDRARAKRERDAALEREAAETPAPAAATSPPAAPATRAAPAPAPPPAGQTAGDPRTGGSRKIDAGRGATGAEQIPPAEDTSTVPDLAPPPQNATQP